MVWLFWSLAALMSAAAAALVLWPLWRRGAAGASRRAENIAIYRERLSELRAEVEAGRVPEAEAESLEAELGRRLLAEAGDETDGTAQEGRIRPWRTSAVLGLAVPALAFGLYLAGGDWRLVGGGPPELPYLEQRLESRVQSEPENIRAWLELGRVREALDEYAEAAEAYGRVNALLDTPRADMLVMEGQARAQARDGDIRGRPVELFERALEADPDNGRALWYVGLSAAQNGDVERARTLWRRLAEQDLPEAFRRTLEQELAALPQESR